MNVENEVKQQVLDPEQANETLEQFRSRVFSLLYTMLQKRVAQLCKDYCYQNRYEFVCTVDARWGGLSDAVSLCDWGNASFVWIMDDLFKSHRLQALKLESEESIIKYFSKIIHSHVFLERFKDWRFQRRVRVPEYIKSIDPDAHKVYWRLCDNDVAENIAQYLGRPVTEVSGIISNIYSELQSRNKLYLLNLHTVLSLSHLFSVNSGVEVSPDWALSHHDLPVEDGQTREAVMHAYQQLGWLEQYVVDAMVIDGLKAKSVVAALKSMQQTLDDKIQVADLNEQHVYYFLRKTLLKLRKDANLRGL